MKYNHSHVIVFQLFSTAYAYGPHLCYLNENRNSYRTTSHHKNDKDGSSDQRCSQKFGVPRSFAKFLGKHLCHSLLLNKVAGARSFIKKKTWAQVFSCEFYNISKKMFFAEPFFRGGDCFCKKSYHSSLSYIIRRSDFQANSLQRVRLLTETVLQYSTLILSIRKGHSIDVSDNIYGCLCGFSLQMLF